MRKPTEENLTLFEGRWWPQNFTGHCLFFGPDNAEAAITKFEAAGFEVERLDIADPYDDSVRFLNIKHTAAGGETQELTDTAAEICDRLNGDLVEGGFTKRPS